MKNFLAALLLTLLIGACERPEPLPAPIPTEITCTLDLSVVICQNQLCQDITPFANAPIEIFENEQDAIDGINRLRNGTTNDQGMVSLSNLACEFFWVKIVTENRGTYIEMFSLSNVATVNFEQIEFVEGLIYQNGSDGFATQTHISFSNPILGQQSTYRRFEIDNYISFDIPEYTDNMLRVRLANQIDENTFVVEESIDVIEGMLDWPYYPPNETIRNQWTFHGDSITVSPLGSEDYFGSFIWNLSESFENSEADGYTFTLIRPLGSLLDMSMDAVLDAPPHGAGAVEDYTLLNNLFSNLLVDVRSYSGVDGPMKMRIYNREDGVVRSFDFFAGMSLATHGFDLVLE